jgi:hypothetical protein
VRAGFCWLADAKPQHLTTMNTHIKFKFILIIKKIQKKVKIEKKKKCLLVCQTLTILSLLLLLLVRSLFLRRGSGSGQLTHTFGNLSLPHPLLPLSALPKCRPKFKDVQLECSARSPTRRRTFNLNRCDVYLDLF